MLILQSINKIWVEIAGILFISDKMHMWFFNIGIFLWGICGVKRGVVGVENALAVGLYRGEKNKKNTHYYSKLAFFA